MPSTSIYQTHKPGGTDDLYLKLKDSDRVRVRVASEPACSTYDGVKLRYAWIVWNRDLNKPQVFGFGISIYNQVADLVDEWGEVTTFDVVIKRTGSGLQDTSYSVTPVKTSEDLTKAELEEVEKIDLPKAVKGRWLADYVEDRVMPDTIESNQPQEPAKDEVVPMPEEMPEDFALKDLPDGF